MVKPLDVPPSWRERLAEVYPRYLDAPSASIEAELTRTDSSRGYLHWEELRRRPTPEGWSVEDFWTLVKFRRLGTSKPLELLAKGGKPFLLNRTDPMSAALHRIDTMEDLWQHLPASPMAAIEEAHHSSAIEGAVTTRRQSEELIRTKREPRGLSERMVLNNYRTIERLGEWVQEPLTAERICEVQSTVTENTLDDSTYEGRFRETDDVKIVDTQSNEVVFAPPPANELPERLDRFCNFANADSTDESFLHPVTRAILVHHQLAYDHPFVDGNGRTARALFMWSILRAGYPWFRNLSISRAVHRAKAQYYRAFRYVQTDDLDVTYFVRQQLRCIEREIRALGDFLEERAKLEQWLLEKRAVSESLNSRQLALIERALDHPDEVFTARAHAESHEVSQPTAWKDLTQLVNDGLLDEANQGRRKLYSPSKKLKRLRAMRPEKPSRD